MKRNTFLTVIACGMLLISGNLKAQSLDDLVNSKSVGDLVNKVSATNTAKVQSVVGVWKFKGAACAYETTDLVRKAGATAIIPQVEQQLNGVCAQAGIKAGLFSFIFTANGTFVNTLNKKVCRGTYTFNKATGAVLLKYQTGLEVPANIPASVAMSGANIALLFDVNKLSELVGYLSTTVSKENLQTATELLEQCKGAKIGFKLGK